MNFLRKIFGQKSSAAADSAPVPATPVQAAPPPAADRADPSPVHSLDFRPVPPSVMRPASPPPAAPPEPPSQSFSYNPDATSRTPASTPPPAAGRAAKVEVTLLAVPGPIWLPPGSPAVELFPAKGESAPHIAFLGGSAQLPAPAEDDNAKRAALTGAAAQLSRALPLYLTEQIELNTPALASTLVAWVVKPTPGFILGGVPWEDSVAAHHARQACGEEPADYLVVCHLRCVDLPWRIELRLIRTIDATCLGTVSVPCSPERPGEALPGLLAELLALLAAQLELVAEPRPEIAGPEIPAPALTPYLVRLEQLLIVRTAAIEGASQTLRGERNIVDGLLHFCVDQPASVPARLLLAHTLGGLRKVRPAVLADFQSRTDDLQSQHPLPEPAHGVTARVLADAFTR
ncbi:MAG: hypothetical protein EAZ36_05915 [Verrucomicrobia bacterium]|nr:MAG: hypothetical protein EAZ36_05915 [Verrucomicrobiota bacterium]